MDASRRNGFAGRAALLAVALAFAATLFPRPALAAPTSVSTEDELRAAVSESSTSTDIKLAADIVLANTLEISAKTLTLDLAGHSLSGCKVLPTAAKTIILVRAGTTCTLRDSSGSNAGRVTAGERGIENHGSLSIMTGRICGNTGACDGNGIYNAEDGSLTIAGGVIEENVSLKGHDGAGICNYGKANISNGLIQNNSTDTAVDSTGYGGAIYNGKGGNLTLSGGNVSSNHAERGGAVYIKSNSEVMVLMGRTRVQKNVATTFGGAIYNESGSKSSKLSFMAGTISENEAGRNGGGIYNDGTMASSGGSVTKNRSASMGGAGIYQNGTFLISGSLVVQGNTDADGVDNDVYIKEKHTLTLEAALTSRAKIGVFCDDAHQIFTTNFSEFNEGSDPSTFFFGNPNDKQEDIRFFMVDEGDVYGEVQCVIVIHYKDENGGEQECIWYREATTDHWGDWDEKDPVWFVARKDKKINDYIGVRGDVNLILVAGKTLKTECIELNRTDDKVRAQLTIYNSFDDEYGKLIADARGSRSAGIGFRHGNSRGGSVTIVGGWIEAYGGHEGAGIGGVENHGNGPIKILGGHVIAKGGKWAAGIGGGQGGDQDNPIRIENAYVEAYGGKHGAGIGGGDSDRGGADGGKVTIKNSTVKAYGKDRGAGIGGGEDGDGGNVTITNSDVYAEGGSEGAGIGGGQDCDDGGTLTVKSGTVNAFGGKEAAAIGGGQDGCGGQFIAEGGTIFALAGNNCSTAIGAGHKDYHEGSKKVYDAAMVTVSHYHDGKDAYVVDAGYRVEGCSWHYVKIEPCTHPDAKVYTDLGPEVHRLANCLYCTAEGPREEAHVFDSNTHVCPCGHREIAITLKDGAEDAGKTSYVSEGLKYRLPYKFSLEKHFVGWQVTGTNTPYPDTLRAGTEIDVELAGGAEGIVATAQWTDRHQHGLVEHPATEPTCTTDGNILYWECEEPNGDSQPCGGLFVKDEEGFLVPVSYEDTVIPALGHDWGEATYTWSEDNDSCEARHTCARCNFVGTEEARVISWTIDQSCTKAKASSHVALFSDESFETQHKTVEEGEPLGHLWGDPTYEWSDDHLTCTARRVCARDEDDEETEVANATVARSGATCSQEGTVTYTATFDNEAFETQVVEVKDVDPSAHAWGEPTFTWSDTPEGKLCTARRVCQNDPAHVEEEALLAQESVIKAETCMLPGEKIYTATFANRAFGTQKLSVEVPAKGHAWGEWVTDGSGALKSRVCAHDSSHVQTTTIPAEGHVHTLRHVNGSAATCSTVGLREHWVCAGDNGCGHYFADEAATEELFFDDVFLPELGHSWGEPTYQWSEDGQAAYAIRRCTRNPLHFQLGYATASEDVLNAPTCTEWGETVYTATFDNPAFAPQSRDAEVAPIGHEFAEWERTIEPTCETAGEEVSHCSHDESHVKTRAVEPLGHEWGDWTTVVGPTETEEGVEERACTRCDTVQRRAVPAASHVHEMSLTEAIAATCVAPGRVAYWVCDKGSDPCGRAFADPLGLRELSNGEIDVPALGHNWAAPTYEWSEDDGTCTARRVCLNDASHVEEETAATSVEVKSSPTCTTGGTTVYRAAFANEAFEPQTKTISEPALGHTPAMQPRHTNVVAPTCLEGGGYDAETYCLTCGARIGEPVHVAQGPLGHDWDSWTQTKAPTCTDEGVEERVCERDPEHKETRAVAPTGHEWSNWAQTTPPTETEQGIETRTCLHDGTHTQTRTIAPTNHEHVPLHVDAKAATCTEAGCIEHWACEGQTCTFVSFGEGEPTLTLEDGTRLWKVDPLSVVLDPLGHAWDEGTPVEGHEATCTMGGQATFRCERDGCDATKVENVDALGHRPFETVVTNLLDPTCVAPGFSWSKLGCDRCHQTLLFLLRTTPTLGHDWGDWSVTVPATKTSEGEIARFCNRDASHKEAIAIPMLTPDHEHAWEEPTYTWSDDLGEVTATRVCKDDAEHVETEVARAVVEPGSGGRVQVVPVVITFPTCTETGETRYTAWFENPGFAVQERTVVTPAYGHDWSDWEIVREATPDADGLERHTCSRCGITEERALAWPDADATPTYRAEADEVVWERGSGEGATFTFKRSVDDETTFSHFVGVTVDGEVVDDERFDARSGSAIVTFHADYLEGLDLGEHEVQALFDDGEPARATLRVVEADGEAGGGERRSPATGDATSGATAALLGVLAFGFFVLGSHARKAV